MKHFILFDAVNTPAIDLLATLTNVQRGQTAYQPRSLAQAAFLPAATVTLPYPFQGEADLPVTATRFAVSLDTGQIIVDSADGPITVMHLYDLLGRPDLARRDPAGEAFPLYVMLGTHLVSRKLMATVMPPEVVEATYKADGTLPVFLTPKSLLSLAIAGLTAIGETVVDRQTGRAMRPYPTVTFPDLFPDFVTLD